MNTNNKLGLGQSLFGLAIETQGKTLYHIQGGSKWGNELKNENLLKN